jgi:hypothetical protein
MPVHTVAEMRELIGTATVDGRFIAVAGYWSWQGIPCPYLPHASPITGFCSGVSFSDAPQRPEFGYIGDSDIVAVPETLNGNLLSQSQTENAPGAVVVIGHRGDARAAQCVSNCQGTLVIDNVAWVNGSLTPDPNSGPFASAVMPGEQLLAAIETDSALMNDVDPRLIGQSTGVVRFVRVATTAPDVDGLRDGRVRLVRPGTSITVAELPLRVEDDYDPARLILDLGPHSYYENNRTQMVTVSRPGSVLLEGALGYGITPLLLESGDYQLHGWVRNAAEEIVDGVECDLEIAPTASEHLAFEAKFSKSGCKWSTEDSTF